jgi:hypothetical protein
MALVACLALFAAPAGAAVAQEAFPARSAAPRAEDALRATFAPGTRVRIDAPTVSRERIVGTVRALRADSIVLDTADAQRESRMFFPTTVLVEDYRRVTLAVGEVAHMERSRGRSRLLGALKTGIRGALIAGTIAGLGSLSAGSRDGITLRDFTRGAGEGAVLGIAIGGSFGWAYGSERWQPVAVPRRKTVRDFFAGSSQ